MHELIQKPIEWWRQRQHAEQFKKVVDETMVEVRKELGSRKLSELSLTERLDLFNKHLQAHRKR